MLLHANIYAILPQRYIEFPLHSMIKIFLRNDLMSPLLCKTHAAWENMFFTVPIIKLGMFGSYISIIGASKETKTQVISIHMLFSDFSN